MQKLTVSNNGRYFTAFRLNRLYAIESFSDWVRFVGSSGDYLVLDEFFNVGVYGPDDFKTLFKIIHTEQGSDD